MANTRNPRTAAAWWKEHIVYQVYPRSFKDSTGNGVGDLRGIIDKLDYIKSLGVTAVWINPIYASPNDDNGYDISDYRAIMPEFGTMEDFDEMIAGMHARGIEFIMDLVLNHTSDEHPWFQQSRSSRDNPYRDYYHWWPAENGTPPHRHSFFDETGSAWRYDELTDAYYLHYFSRKQPDLNWENPMVREEMYNIMEFWIAKGVNGFRLDAFQFISKDHRFPELPSGYDNDPVGVIKHHGMGPHLHDYLREMNDRVLSQHKVFAVGEGAGSTKQDAHDLADESRRELQMVYHFEVTDLGSERDDCKPTLAEFKRVHNEWQASFQDEGWLSIFMANHDVPRMVSKFGDDRPQFRAYSAMLLNTFLLTMRGTPYCYYGDEIGMVNIAFDDIHDYRDIAAINGYKKAQAEGQDMQRFMSRLKYSSRDNSRTPMQWDDSEFAGFSTTKPWLAIHPNHQAVNVEVQESDPNSVLHHFRQLTHLRRQNEVLVYGDYRAIQPQHEDVYAYERASGNQKLLIVLNFSAKETEIELSEISPAASILIANHGPININGRTLSLSPYQALVFEISCEDH